MIDLIVWSERRADDGVVGMKLLTRLPKRPLKLPWRSILCQKITGRTESLDKTEIPGRIVSLQIDNSSRVRDCFRTFLGHNKIGSILVYTNN